MIAEIQVAPRPGGSDTEPYRHVDAAIAVIKASDLTHEVGAMGTTVEGDPDAIWALVREVHEACLTAGATAVTSHIKVGQAVGDRGPQIADLVTKHRP